MHNQRGCSVVLPTPFGPPLSPFLLAYPFPPPYASFSFHSTCPLLSLPFTCSRELSLPIFPLIFPFPLSLPPLHFLSSWTSFPLPVLSLLTFPFSVLPLPMSALLPLSLFIFASPYPSLIFSSPSLRIPSRLPFPTSPSPSYRVGCAWVRSIMGSWEHSSELVDRAIRQVFVRIKLEEI